MLKRLWLKLKPTNEYRGESYFDLIRSMTNDPDLLSAVDAAERQELDGYPNNQSK